MKEKLTQGIEIGTSAVATLDEEELDFEDFASLNEEELDY